MTFTTPKTLVERIAKDLRNTTPEKFEELRKQYYNDLGMKLGLFNPTKPIDTPSKRIEL